MRTGIEAISENVPRWIRAAQELGTIEGTKIVHVACGRNHTLLVGSCGSVWSAGVNTYGQVRFFFGFFFHRTLNIWQCGHSVCLEMTSFKFITDISHHENRERHLPESIFQLS